MLRPLIVMLALALWRVRAPSPICFEHASATPPSSKLSLSFKRGYLVGLSLWRRTVGAIWVAEAAWIGLLAITAGCS